MEQVQSAQAQLAHESVQLPHWQLAWLHVAQVQSAHRQFAQESAQLAQAHVEHSS
ncbi:hypothetical protein [Kutzneria kofuensis]|uniref:Uncharacterized protein n=1 Tax=Kutzneria kofuensis TaxID=103725 RepID=A0A7W9KHL4_9PSEU|nr:hypothetical protein [Kutzneria kofuensis]MBB5892721.1 hypothetical protein [Kutzneria kofuensis]